MSRMAEDVSRVRLFTGPAVMYLINLVTLISLSVFFMFKRQPELTLYVLAPLPILAFIIYYVKTHLIFFVKLCRPHWVPSPQMHSRPIPVSGL